MSAGTTHDDRDDQRSADEVGELAGRLPEVCRLVRDRTGHDFAAYKATTLLRRIRRRLQARRLGVEEYVALLRDDPAEAIALESELLIGVTQFFRDPDSLDVLAKLVLGPLAGRGPREPVRVWVPGCSTGEEPYSLAMLLAELGAGGPGGPEVRIFATDIDRDAIETARHATYPDSIAEHVSPARLARFFAKSADRWRIADGIREACVFSEHDLLRDTPFSSMDLVSCRNLLIYFDGEAQARAIPALAHALRPGGHLLLGAAESVPADSELFSVVDLAHRVFERRGGTRAVLPVRALASARVDSMPGSESAPRSDRELARTIAFALLERHAPPAAVIDAHGEILFLSGRTGRFLDPPTGAPSHNLFELVSRGLGAALRAVVHDALRTRNEVVHPGMDVAGEQGLRHVDVAVRPLAELSARDDLLLVVFRERPALRGRSGSADEASVGELEAELRRTREQLQSSLEELRSSNEELLSMNQELQATNQELQQSKEQLHAANERLRLLNAELSQQVDALDRANADLQNLFENTHVPTLFLDASLAIVRFTPPAERVFRLAPNDLGRPISEIVPLVTAPDLTADLRNVLRTLRPIEKQVESEDRSRTYILRINPYRTTTNVISGVVATFADVTELTRAQERQAELAAIVQSSSDAIIGRSADDVITSWNGGAEALFWYSAKEAIGRPFDFLLPPERAHELRELEARAAEDQKVAGIDTERVRKDGKRVSVSLSVSAIRDGEGRLTGWSTIFRDIGDRLRADEAHARLAAIVASSNDAIVGKTLDGIVTSWNAAAERLFGWTAQEMVGASIHRIVAPEQSEDVSRILGSIRRGQPIEHYETVRVRKDGARVHVSLSVSPILDASGRIVGASKIARDIGDRKAAQEALERGMKLRDDFISIASHELKTPLTSMKLQTEIMRRQLGKGQLSPERAMRGIDRTVGQIDRLNRLVDDMLDISRINAGRLSLRCEPVNLSEVAREVLANLAGYMAAAGCEVIEEIEPDVRGTWDRLRIEQVVTNLVTNACRYGRGCPFTLRVIDERASARLEVEDRGIGIAEHDQQRIFERFERVGRSDDSNGGFGIGLYVVRQIVTAHRGAVWVHSELGEGATFVVSLPKDPP